MRKVKLLLILCVVCAWSMTARAQSGDSGGIFLFVEKSNGSVNTIPFTNSEIVLLDDVISVKTPNETIQLSFDEVNNFYFMLKNGTSIEKVGSAKLKTALDASGNLHISGDSPLGDIAVYGISGQLLKKVNSAAAETSIDLSAFAKGVYLVKVKETVVKIVK